MMRLYLSPHFDDAVLSCGGAIHQQVNAGSMVTVRTVMGQKPRDIPDSPLVRELHTRWGAAPVETSPVVARIEEDEAAISHLGARPQRMSIWPDCIYRVSRHGVPLYTSTESLFQAVHADDIAARLIPTIALSPYDATHSLYAPLGAGNHVDHQIVRNWALELRRQTPALEVRFYEDYPYSEKPEAINTALHFFEDRKLNLSPELVYLNEADVQAKIEAIACYHTQISSFWPDVQTMAQQVRAAMTAIGGGKPAERFWYLPGR
jgi:LmbE family N-acetylglucosaminyl deacetylase